MPAVQGYLKLNACRVVAEYKIHNFDSHNSRLNFSRLLDQKGGCQSYECKIRGNSIQNTQVYLPKSMRINVYFCKSTRRYTRSGHPKNRTHSLGLRRIEGLVLIPGPVDAVTSPLFPGPGEAGLVIPGPGDWAVSLVDVPDCLTGDKQVPVCLAGDPRDLKDAFVRTGWNFLTGDLSREKESCLRSGEASRWNESCRLKGEVTSCLRSGEACLWKDS